MRRQSINSDPSGTISIVSHGHGAMLRELLCDLATQEGISAWRVIVTHNVPEPFDLGEFGELNLHLVHNSQPKGFGANHNAAAVQADGAVLLIINPDIRLPARNTLARIAAAAKADSAPVLRAPVVVNQGGMLEDSVRRNLSPLALMRRLTRRRTGWEVPLEEAAFFWVAGMFLAVPLDRFRSLGGFDERFFLYCEDYDFSARWRIAGGAIEVIHDLQVIHDAQRGSHRSLRHLKWHLASLARVWSSRTFWRVSLGLYPRIQS